MLIDTHCHIQFKAFSPDREEIIKRCAEKSVILNVVGTQQSTSEQAVELAKKYKNIYATIGLHPIHGDEVDVIEEGNGFKTRGEEFDSDFYDALIRSSDKVIAVGETGLDAYHVPKGEPLNQVLDKQWSLFLQHMELARKHNLPLVIHVREAHEEMIKRLKDQKIKYGAVVHCFSGNWEQAREYLKLGFYLGFTGVVTFPPKKTNPQQQLDLLEVIKKMPLDKLLVETDAPFLAPQKYRGERCEPWMVEEVVKKIGEIKGVSADEVKEKSTINAKSLFKKLNP
ncbi:MAG: TatD family hydrolase [Patescibacteria group bacterium]